MVDFRNHNVKAHYAYVWLENGHAYGMHKLEQFLHSLRFSCEPFHSSASFGYEFYQAGIHFAYISSLLGQA